MSDADASPPEPDPADEPEPADDGGGTDESELWAVPSATDDADDDAAARIVAALGDTRTELTEARADIAGVQTGLDAMLADLAAGAREESLASGFSKVQRSIDELVRLNRRADEHVAELHAENQRLRAGEIASVTLPLLRDVVRLHDEVTQLASASAPEAQADLDLVRSRLLDTLARWGLSAFSPEVGDALDATRHQGVGRVASAEGAPGTIAAVRRPGFAHDDGRTFRAAEVEVFQAPPEPETETETETAPNPTDEDT